MRMGKWWAYLFRFDSGFSNIFSFIGNWDSVVSFSVLSAYSENER